MKNPSSKLPSLDTMVWFPERAWPKERLSAAPQCWMLREEKRKKRRKIEREEPGLISVSMGAEGCYRNQPAYVNISK